MAVAGATLVALVLVLTSAAATGASPSAAAVDTAPAQWGGPSHLVAARGDGHSLEAAPTTGYALRPALPILPRGGAPGVAGGVTVIGPGCQVTGASAPLLASGTNFTVTGDFSGAILDECNGSGLFGDGYTLTMAANATAALEVYNAAAITVAGFLIAGASTGILAEGVQGLDVNDNTVTSSGYGIEVEYSSEVTVDSNSLSDDYGSLFEVDDGLNVSENALDHTEYGAYAVDVNGAMFANDDCNGSTDALSVYDSTLVTVWGDNLSHSVDGLYAQDVSDLTASWNTASASEYPLQVYYGNDVVGTEDAGPNATIGVTIYFTEDASLTALSFPDAAEYGLEVGDATNVSIANSDFDAAGFEGLFVGDATDVTLTGDTADDFFDAGMVVSQSTDVTITGSEARDGVGSLAPAFSTFFDQGLMLAASNGSASAYGLQDQGSLNLSVRDCQFLAMTNGDAGISLQSDASVTVTDTAIIGATGDALDAFDSSALVVAGNTFTDAAQEAMYVAGSDGVTLEDNNAAFAGFTGFDLEQLDGFSVDGNNLSFGNSSLTVGLYLDADASGSADGNVVTHQPTALELLSATSVAVTNNNLSLAQVGFVVADTVNCTLAGNEVADDASAFNVATSEHLAIYHNNFVDDGGWSLPASPLQANWSDGYPAGGNYWSNHTGPDAYRGAAQNLSGADGIVDTPFELNATNTDPYPLAVPWLVYTITFSESGLPAMTPWSVVVNGTRVAGSGSTIVYDEPNAVASVYAYSIGPVGGFRATEPSGTVAPGRDDAVVAVSFTPFEYTVSFEAAGLAAATTWSIAVGTSSESAPGGSPVTFSLANGSYTYHVTPVVGYAVQPSSGPLVINGAGESITVAFQLLVYTVTFVPVGLPSTESWSVDLGDSQASANGGSLSFREANGTYPFTIGAPSGYLAHPASGTQSVNGTTTVFVAFTPSNPTPLGTPLGLALVIAVIGLAFLALVAVALWRRASRRRPPDAPITPAAPAGNEPVAGPASTEPRAPPDAPERWRR